MSQHAGHGSKTGCPQETAGDKMKKPSNISSNKIVTNDFLSQTQMKHCSMIPASLPSKKSIKSFCESVLQAELIEDLLWQPTRTYDQMTGITLPPTICRHACSLLLFLVISLVIQLSMHIHTDICALIFFRFVQQGGKSQEKNQPYYLILFVRVRAPWNQDMHG